MVPKDNLSYRNAAQLHPIDSIVLSAILFEYGGGIEIRRSPKDVVFSYRFSPLADGTMYANKTAWDDFWKASRNRITIFEEEEGDYILREEYEYVVAVDISDFYNQIYLHSMENQMIACALPNQVKKKLSDLLKTLNQSSSRVVPIGPHSSHLLAEMSLIQVYSTLTLRQIPFVRYVDDIVFFCKNRKEARIRVLQIAEILDKEQRLTVQRHKTREFTSNEFLGFANGMLIEEPI